MAFTQKRDYQTSPKATRESVLWGLYGNGILIKAFRSRWNASKAAEFLLSRNHPYQSIELREIYL